MQDFHFEYAKDQNGVELPYRFVMTTRKKLSKLKDKLPLLLSETVDGIDLFQVLGMYSIEIVVARTYDPKEVVEQLKKELTILQSDIITPKLKLV